MQETTKLDTQIRKLLNSQKFSVISTQEQDHPYLNLVAFAETGDLRTILFATSRSTRKYGNLQSRSGVALLVENSSNDAADIHDAMAVTIVGVACEVSPSDREALERVYLKKQPQMEDFLFSPSTALIGVDVESYILVNSFQNVTTLNMK